MKNLFILKTITNNRDISDEAFTVWCGLRSIMRQGVMEYFVSYNMIAHSVFNRVPNRYELVAIKQGYTELKDKGYIKEITEFSKTEHVVDLTALYFEKNQGYFSDLSQEEMHKIMNLDCGRHSKYKLLRYFTCMVGTFNHSKDMSYYGNKIGGMGLDYFCELIPITKPTCIAFNEILEQNELLFIIRHKDFIQSTTNGYSEIREIPNTYSRWADQEYAKRYAENTHGYKYFAEKYGQNSSAANEKRSLGQKLIWFMNGREYDIDTVKKLYMYAKQKNEQAKAEYERSGSVQEPYYYSLEMFDCYLIDTE